MWPTTTENKCFVKMLWHLLGEYVKATVLLVCSICTIHRFFLFFYFYSFLVIDLCSLFYSICALFIQRFSLFIYSSILVSHFVFFIYLFFLFFIFKFWTVATVLRGAVATFFFPVFRSFFFSFIYTVILT